MDTLRLHLTDRQISLKGAELSEIKKTYRKLALEFHPDKAPKEKAQEYEAIFVEIAKAHKV